MRRATHCLAAEEAVRRSNLISPEEREARVLSRADPADWRIGLILALPVPTDASTPISMDDLFPYLPAPPIGVARPRA